MAAHTGADRMTAPTSAALALLRSNLPVKRVASSSLAPTKPFSSTLKSASFKAPNASTAAKLKQAPLFHAANFAGCQPSPVMPGGPSPMSRSEILKNAQQLLNIPYVWGGTSSTGLDCSAFVSKLWGVDRHTTDTLGNVARPVSKDELQAGDALNLTTGSDPDGTGHVRLFDQWADAAHTKMWVYEETPPRSVHHVINWDPKYQPMRRTNVINA
jgi:cell wall-associated NlpC family hydrolase